MATLTWAIFSVSLRFFLKKKKLKNRSSIFEFGWVCFMQLEKDVISPVNNVENNKCEGKDNSGDSVDDWDVLDDWKLHIERIPRSCEGHSWSRVSPRRLSCSVSTIRDIKLFNLFLISHFYTPTWGTSFAKVYSVTTRDSREKSSFSFKM